MIFHPMFEGFMGSMMSSGSSFGNTAQLEAELAKHKSDLKMVEDKKKSSYSAYKLDLYILDVKRERLLQDNKLDHIVKSILQQPSGQHSATKGRKKARGKNHRIQPTNNEQLLLLQNHDNETSFLKESHEEEYEKLQGEQRCLIDLIHGVQIKLGRHEVGPPSSGR